jgi:hypothetical protein|eukprot:5548980-Prymnesium_polylepis.1
MLGTSSLMTDSTCPENGVKGYLREDNSSSVTALSRVGVAEPETLSLVVGVQHIWIPAPVAPVPRASSQLPLHGDPRQGKGVNE